MTRLVAVLLFLALMAIPASAFAQASESGNDLSLEQLQTRLAELKAELAAEQSALAKQQALQAAEMGTLQQQRADLASDVFDLQLTRESLTNKLQALKNDEQSAKEEAVSMSEAAAAVARAVRDAAEQLRLHLQEVPGREDEIRRLREAASLEWSAETDSDNVAELETVFGELDRAHKEAGRVTLRKASIFTANGEREQVELLSLGHVRFAYRADENRVGLALASAEDAAGFRWSEQLDEKSLERALDVFESAQSQTPRLASLPLDPTGRVRPESLSSDDGLLERLRAGGLVMAPLAIVALIALAMILERIFVFYLANPGGRRLAQRVVDACREGSFEQAEQLCRRSRGAIARVLEACLARRSSGQRAMEDSIQEQLLHELPRLQRFMRGIATLAGVAPLLGLLGTVTGIIRTFGVIRAFGNANPELMAGGISEALLTTAAGLVIAVPILIAHSLLRGRSDRIIADCESHAARLLTTLSHDQLANEPPSPDESGDDKPSQPQRELAVD